MSSSIGGESVPKAQLCGELLSSQVMELLHACCPITAVARSRQTAVHAACGPRGQFVLTCDLDLRHSQPQTALFSIIPRVTLFVARAHRSSVREHDSIRLGGRKFTAARRVNSITRKPQHHPLRADQLWSVLGLRPPKYLTPQSTNIGIGV